ncbi:unnamed protein product [Caenorhabditis brenneri]
MLMLFKCIPEEVITMIEVPTSPGKSASSITSEKQLDAVNDPLAAMTLICVQSVATASMSCHMDPITTVAESLTAPSKDSTSNQISPAKDDEIEAAKKGWKHKSNTTSIMKQPFQKTYEGQCSLKTRPDLDVFRNHEYIMEKSNNPCTYHVPSTWPKSNRTKNYIHQTEP